MGTALLVTWFLSQQADDREALAGKLLDVIDVPMQVRLRQKYHSPSYQCPVDHEPLITVGLNNRVGSRVQCGEQVIVIKR